MRALTAFLPGVALLSIEIAAQSFGGIVSEPARLALSSVQGATSPEAHLVVRNQGRAAIPLPGATLRGPHASMFELLFDGVDMLQPGDSVVATVRFAPDSSLIGVFSATAEFDVPVASPLRVQVTGLGLRGLEGGNEPPLSNVLLALGMDVNPGWAGLGNHTRNELQGEETGAALFRRAAEGPVVMRPVARFSPDFELPFGYYLLSEDEPVVYEVGALAEADERPQHQTLYPDLARGSMGFDPGDAVFGLFTISPSHTAYSEDRWNRRYHPDNAAHAVRVYPLRDAEGRPAPDAFLVCFEEARNGDYQDYVFILENVRVVP